LLGERAYLIGGTCDTCAFIFERMGGANRNVSPGKTANALRGGLKRIEGALVSTIGEVMPEGNYRVNLLELTPNLVRPGAEEDYFAHEQVELWGTDRFWDLPTIRRPSTIALLPCLWGAANVSSSSSSPCFQRAG
jgi:hypothetical protein